MTTDLSAPFATWAPVFRRLGLYPRPVRPSSKVPVGSAWQKPDPEIASGVLEGWLQTYATHGIGVLTGTPLPDGSLFAALDIDRDDYVRVAEALLGNPPCGRIGARGAVFFVRLRGDGRYRPFVAKTAQGRIKVGELLCNGRFCVLPPTIHPNGQSYRWIRTPLHEIQLSDLPLMEA
jgi:hypothetical protein